RVLAAVLPVLRQDLPPRVVAGGGRGGRGAAIALLAVAVVVPLVRALPHRDDESHWSDAAPRQHPPKLVEAVAPRAAQPNRDDDRIRLVGEGERVGDLGQRRR